MKNVLVTGASSGLGRACALQLAEKGYRVFAGVRREENGESLRSAARGYLIPVILDVTLAHTIEAAREACERDGGLFGLVNNAGITVAGPIERVYRDARAQRPRPRNRAPQPPGFLLRLWSRLNRAATRFCALAAGAPGSRPRRRKRQEEKTRTRAPDLPRRRGWILDPVPEAAASAGQLREFLADPDVQTLVGSDPRFGRILRPLCRTIGLKPPGFLLLPKPPGAKKRRRPKARRKGARKPKWLAGLMMSGPFHPPGHPPGYIPPRRTRAPPRTA